MLSKIFQCWIFLSIPFFLYASPEETFIKKDFLENQKGKIQVGFSLDPYAEGSHILNFYFLNLYKNYFKVKKVFLKEKNVNISFYEMEIEYPKQFLFPVYYEKIFLMNNSKKWNFNQIISEYLIGEDKDLILSLGQERVFHLHAKGVHFDFLKLSFKGGLFQLHISYWLNDKMLFLPYDSHEREKIYELYTMIHIPFP